MCCKNYSADLHNMYLHVKYETFFQSNEANEIKAYFGLGFKGSIHLSMWVMCVRCYDHRILELGFQNGKNNYHQRDDVQERILCILKKRNVRKNVD